MLNIVSCWGARNAMKIYSQLHSQCSSSRGWASPEEEVMPVVAEFCLNQPFPFGISSCCCHPDSLALSQAHWIAKEARIPTTILAGYNDLEIKISLLRLSGTPGGLEFQKWGIKPKRIVAKGSMAGLV